MHDFAVRLGYRCGTMLVDIAASGLVDLQADRSAAALAGWLTRRQPPPFICRDRTGEYTRGARQGAPEAIQVADRFHLGRTSSEVLERVLQRHSAALGACVQAEMQPPPPHPSASAEAPSTPPATRRAQQARLLATYARVKTLYQQGWLPADIGVEVGLSQPTVRRYVRATSFPERSHGAPRLAQHSPWRAPADPLAG